jgi:hypothetical protein
MRPFRIALREEEVEYACQEKCIAGNPCGIDRAFASQGDFQWAE